MVEFDNSAAQSANAGGGIGFLDLAIIVVENLKLLIIAPLAVGLMALGYAFTITPTFVAKATFLPPQPQQEAAAATALQSLGAVAGLVGAAAMKNPADQYVALLTSKTVIDRIIDRFDFMKVYNSKYREHARRIVEGSIKAISGKDGLIKIEVDDEDPKRAAAVANAFVEELGTLLGRLALTEAQQRRLFFEKQLKDTKQALTQAQLALQASGADVSTLKVQPLAVVSGIAELKALVVTQEMAVESLRTYLAETSPDFMRAKNELAIVRRQLAKAAAVVQPVAGESDYVTKYREYKYQETLFDLFARQYELAKLDESRDSSVVQIVDPATPPELKSRPKKAAIAILTTLATALALLLFVFARTALRAAAASPETSAKLSRLRTVFGGMLLRKKR